MPIQAEGSVTASPFATPDRVFCPCLSSPSQQIVTGSDNDQRSHLRVVGLGGCSLLLRPITIKHKLVPMSQENFICRPAVGLNQQQVEIQMTDFDNDLLDLWRHYHGHHYNHQKLKQRPSCVFDLSVPSYCSSFQTSCCRHWRRKSCSCSSKSSEATKSLTLIEVHTSDAVTSTKVSKISQERLSQIKAPSSSAEPKSKGTTGGVLLGRNNSNSSTHDGFVSAPDTKWSGRIVHVQGDGRCLFRSLVAASHIRLQRCRRDEYGRPESYVEAREEMELADNLRAMVVSFMKENIHFYSQLDKGLINADQPSPMKYGKFRDRLDAMSRATTMPGELELNAACCVLERMIVVLDTDMDIINVYGDDRFPESIPLTVRFTRLGEDVGHYDAVLLGSDFGVDQNWIKNISGFLREKLEWLNGKMSDKAGVSLDKGKYNMDTEAGDNRNVSMAGTVPHLDTSEPNINDNLPFVPAVPTEDMSGVRHFISVFTQTSGIDLTQRRRKRRPRQNMNRSNNNKGRGGKRHGQRGKMNHRSRGKKWESKRLNRKKSRVSFKRPRSVRESYSYNRPSKYRKTDFSLAGHRKRNRNVRKNRRVARYVQVTEPRYVLLKPYRPNDKNLSVCPPLNPRLPLDFTEGVSQCFLCGKKVSKQGAGNWLKCYLCGRTAHQDCAVQQSSAWFNREDNYFLCNDCVTE